MTDDFDESITLPAASHAAFTKALAALRVDSDGIISHVTNAPGVAALSLARGYNCRIGCGRPDKPGTVRAPGSRFVPRVAANPKRWAEK